MTMKINSVKQEKHTHGRNQPSDAHLTHVKASTGYVARNEDYLGFSTSVMLPQISPDGQDGVPLF